VTLAVRLALAATVKNCYFAYDMPQLQKLALKGSVKEDPNGDSAWRTHLYKSVDFGCHFCKLPLNAEIIRAAALEAPCGRNQLSCKVTDWTN
jgi:hypothetical protein